MEGGEENASSQFVEGDAEGAVIMGRNMFGGGCGPWDESWTGWWGEDPPFHLPVFVLTHYARPTLHMDGGTTFTFVTDGIESALRQARLAAGDKDVAISGGGRTAAQYLAAGLVDEIAIHVVPVLLGNGVRLFDLIGDASIRLEQLHALGAPGVTHIRYRVTTTRPAS